MQAAGFSGGLLGSFLSQLPISDHACGGHDVTVEVSHKPEEAEAREGAKESHVRGDRATLEPTRFTGQELIEIFCGNEMGRAVTKERS